MIRSKLRSLALLQAATVALLMALDGCASKPERFYTLDAAAESTAAPLNVSVSVGPVSIPAMVDTSAIMVSVAPSEVQPNDLAHWASPLRESIAQAVAGDLSALLGTARVSLAADAWTQRPDYRVAIEVDRFESVIGEAATLDALWLVRRNDTVLQEGRTTVREQTHGQDMGALAAAHSRALARLSEDIAGAIRSVNQAGGNGIDTPLRSSP